MKNTQDRPWLALEQLLSNPLPKDRRAIGLEVEWIGMRNDGSSFHYSDEKDPSRTGVGTLLRELGQKHGWVVDYSTEGQPLGLHTPFGKVTLEPGAQLELSAEPRNSLHDVKALYDDFEAKVNALTQPLDISWLPLGLNPYHSATEVELIPSKRYQIMDRYFVKRGALATSMMRLTSSIQINLDYHSESEAIEMLRVAFLLAPLSYVLFSNSPFKQRRLVPWYSYRRYIWSRTDRDRTGVILDVFHPKFDFEAYAQHLWKLPLMFAYDQRSNYVAMQGRTLEDISQGRVEGVELNGENVLTPFQQLFTEARLKPGYIEIRSVDGLPSPFRYAAVAFWMGVLYSQKAREFVLRNLDQSIIEQLPQQLERVSETGLTATLYRSEYYSLARQLMPFIESELKARGAFENDFLDPLYELLHHRRCPGHDWEKKYLNDWGLKFPLPLQLTQSALFFGTVQVEAKRGIFLDSM